MSLARLSMVSIIAPSISGNWHVVMATQGRPKLRAVYDWIFSHFCFLLSSRLSRYSIV